MLDIDVVRAEAARLLEPHRKEAVCKRAAGPSLEFMVSVNAATDLLTNALIEVDRLRAIIVQAQEWHDLNMFWIANTPNEELLAILGQYAPTEETS